MVVRFHTNLDYSDCSGGILSAIGQTLNDVNNTNGDASDASSDDSE